MSEIVWNIDIDTLKGRQVSLETKDGIRREGKITNVECVGLMLNRRRVLVPSTFTLNHDETDRISFAHILKMTVE